jgi:hypothetical protein
MAPAPCAERARPEGDHTVTAACGADLDGEVESTGMHAVTSHRDRPDHPAGDLSHPGPSPPITTSGLAMQLMALRYPKTITSGVQQLVNRVLVLDHIRTEVDVAEYVPHATHDHLHTSQVAPCAGNQALK